MPPKQRITREMILEKSFSMFCRDGMEAVNARSVAKALNCSTQPIFSYFSGMDDLKNALDQKARDAFEQALAEARGDSTIDQACAGYIRFAVEQPRLFAHMFLNISEGQAQVTMNAMLRTPVVETECAQASLSQEDAREICQEMWIFAHGLAALQASGQSAFTPEQIQRLITKTHEALRLGAQHSQEHTEA